jgi:hypothetical protein
VEQEQDQKISEPQISEAASDVPDISESVLDESNELPQDDSEQEAEDDSWPGLDNSQYVDEKPVDFASEKTEQDKE